MSRHPSASSFSGSELSCENQRRVIPSHVLREDRLVQNALAVKFGHRIVYLLSLILVCVSLVQTDA